MAMEQSKKLADWVRRQCFNRKARIQSITIRHLVKGLKEGETIYTIDIDLSEKLDANRIDDLIGEVETACISDAESISEFQKYVVRAHLDGEEKSTARIVLKYNIRDEFDDEPLDTEGPNKTGLLSQTMRHLEATQKISLGGTNAILQMMARTIESQARQVDTLTARHLEGMKLREELTSQKHERDLEASIALTKQEAIRDVTQKALLLLPMVVNKISGKSIMKTETTPEEELFRAFLGSITPEQYDKLGEVLTPQQSMVMAGAMNKLIEENKAKAEAENRKNGVQLRKVETVEVVNGEEN